MDVWLLGVGVGKVAFGLGIAVSAVWLATRVLGRVLGLDRVEHAPRDGNAAVGVAQASALPHAGPRIFAGKDGRLRKPRRQMQHGKSADPAFIP